MRQLKNLLILRISRKGQKSITSEIARKLLGNRSLLKIATSKMGHFEIDPFENGYVRKSALSQNLKSVISESLPMDIPKGPLLTFV